MHTYTYIYIYTHVHTYIYTHIYINIHMYFFIYISCQNPSKSNEFICMNIYKKLKTKFFYSFEMGKQNQKLQAYSISF